ncbi:hypothetical protein [Xenorhabdus szentirmaii]|uniref:Uncharacterized protein n=1 Tax=Xenorhabdus szentirmaii DSM 16338 TaxID=1427518 RepID=W1J2U0_9GAMM|nr:MULTISPECIES: hypothetical protein [Xenorhabdus]MBD2806445.1 hypothetical protein [Xenorhabdus sp. ZM]MBD2822431.1 hypothetical protein [Xenorhabdus sp. 42]PHM30888.1 hypothetical protein Xsze_04004 [Xenorhabdus szentirmaii DSM 16338]PHM40367.1 hypothetical protein Xszus_00024 [Xenorhabdus szentirmaii]CDL83775.1 hypothetical protein XSR1_360053 [Xenorhabdus szentirmaii DSM 16338]
MTKTTVTFNFGNGPVDVEATKGEYKDIVLRENEFSTDPSWWRVKDENGIYTFSCLSGALAGGECHTEITKEENDKLRSGEMTAEEICRKYKIG